MLHWDDATRPNPLWGEDEIPPQTLGSELISWGLVILTLVLLWTGWGILVS